MGSCIICTKISVETIQNKQIEIIFKNHLTFIWFSDIIYSGWDTPHNIIIFKERSKDE